VRSALTQLYLAQGTPMLLGGDELYRTQGGNNNAYCQDNNISWLNWEASDRSLMAYIKELSQLRSALHHGARDFWVKFFHQGGSAITEKEAETASLHLTCLMRSDENAPWLIMSNPTDSDAEFNLPPEVHKLVWSIRMDSYNLLDFKSGAKIHSEQALTVKSHSLLVLSSTKI
jgi:glycogen operon protein